MASEIQSRLAGNVVGFAHAIADRSQLAIAGAGGLAQRSPDATEPMTSRIHSTVASVTKHLIAVATLALLERNGIDPNTSIVDFLPAAWDPASSVNGLTFEHLLTHTSGFNQLLSPPPFDGTGNGWDGLEVPFSAGPLAATPQSHVRSTEPIAPAVRGNARRMRVRVHEVRADDELGCSRGGIGSAVRQRSAGLSLRSGAASGFRCVPEPAVAINVGISVQPLVHRITRFAAPRCRDARSARARREGRAPRRAAARVQGERRRPRAARAQAGGAWQSFHRAGRAAV